MTISKGKMRISTGKRERHPRASEGRGIPGPVSRLNPIRCIAELDKLLHEPTRLAILSALSRAPGGLGYTFTRHVLGKTQGNLATHLQKLEAAGLIEIHRRYIMRRQYSRIYITETGSAAVEDHWRELWDLHSRLERWTPAVEEGGDLTQEQFEALPLKPPDPAPPTE